MSQPTQELIEVDLKQLLDDVIEEMSQIDPQTAKHSFVLATKLVDLFCESSAPIGVVALAMALVLRHSLDDAEAQYEAALKNKFLTRRIQ